MKNISAKLVRILGALGAVEKKGYNKNQNYHYMREVDVLEALKTELVKEKIILLTSSRFVEMRDKPKTDKNDNKVVEFVTTVETTHRFIDSESGEEVTISSVGSGYDSLDKGASKAITASVKYALLKTFMISDEGADIENDGETKAAPVHVPTPPARKTLSRPNLKTEAAPTPAPETPAAAPAAAPAEPAQQTVQKPRFPRRAPNNTAQFVGHAGTPNTTEPKF
jgi:hypothetical protein